MPDETSAIAEDFGVSIDPATWEDPKETFPGVIDLSRKRWASDKYLAGKTFWEGFDPTTAKLPQWDLRIRRLDAVIVLPDGQQVPAIRYGGIDLLKWSARARKLVPVTSANRKESEVTNAFKRIFGRVEPPELLEGRIAIFEFYRKRSYAGSNMPASNVLLPIQVLPPTYTFDGTVQMIQARASTEEVTEGPTEEAHEAATPTISADEATVAVLPYLKGMNKNNPAAIITALPTELRIPAVLSALATGSLIEQLISGGKVSVAPDGTITPV